jgi:hypothetical protein
MLLFPGKAHGPLPMGQNEDLALRGMRESKESMARNKDTYKLFSPTIEKESDGHSIYN